MPLVFSSSHGQANISTSSSGPNSHLGLALFVMLCINPPFGLIAVCFAAASRHAAGTDWDGARMRGKISMFISIAGIVITVVGVLVFVLIFYTRDT